MDYPAWYVFCELENDDSEWKRTISKVCGTTFLTGSKCRYVNTTIEEQKASTTSQGGPFIPGIIWMTYPFWPGL